MRLIDADALKKMFSSDNKTLHDTICLIIDAAPTVSASVHGEWVRRECEGELLAICPNCNYPVSWWHKTSYCSNCGAKMAAK